jgi:hypothetical protein
MASIHARLVQGEELMERWSAEDSQERRDRIKDADVRLEAWAKWSRTQARPGGASSSNWFMALNPATGEESQAGAKHVAECCPDEEAMQVDAIIARWMLEERWYWKIARREYLYYGPQDLKASQLGISKAFYRQLLDELRTVLWRELDLLAKKSTKRGKLVEVPA